MSGASSAHRSGNQSDHAVTSVSRSVGIASAVIAGTVDPSVIGAAVIALYMGLEIVARMRGGDSTGSSALMTTLVQAAPWIDQLLSKSSRARRRPTTRVAIE